MGEVRLSVEADSIKEVFEDIACAFEEMGALIIKGSSELPENLAEVLKTQGVFLFKPSEGVSKELVLALLDEDQEEVLETIINEEEALTRLQECLEEKEVYPFNANELSENAAECLVENHVDQLVETLLDNDQAVSKMIEALKGRGFEVKEL